MKCNVHKVAMGFEQRKKKSKYYNKTNHLKFKKNLNKEKKRGGGVLHTTPCLLSYLALSKECDDLNKIN